MGLYRIEPYLTKGDVVEKADASGPEKPDVYRDPSVARVFRRSVCDYERCGAYRPHLDVLKYGEPSEPRVTREEWAKAVPGPCFGAARRMRNWRGMAWLDDRDRDIGVFYAGQVEPYPPPIREHRKALARAQGATVHIGRPLDQRRYHDAMRRTKVALCPWGNGELTYRLYESWHAGCVPVMPLTDWMTTWFGRLEAGTHYVPCDPHGSDIDDVCGYVQAHWTEYDAMRERNYALANRVLSDEFFHEWRKGVGL